MVAQRLAQLARRAIITLQMEERTRGGAVIGYNDGAFGVFSVVEYSAIVLGVPEVARQRLQRRLGRLLRNRSPGELDILEE